MIFRPSSFWGRRLSFISTRSSERLFASSSATLAVFDQLPANWRIGASEPTKEFMRSDSFTRFIAVSLMYGFPSIAVLSEYYKTSSPDHTSFSILKFPKRRDRREHRDFVQFILERTIILSLGISLLVLGF